MPTQSRTEELARRFEREYPPDLSGRLRWLKKHLGIDRTRFLRLFGLTPEEIREGGSIDWDRLIARDEQHAWWVEEILCQLLALYRYDWLALSEDLHRRARTTVEAGRLVRNGEAERLWYRPDEAGRNPILLSLIAEGGPQGLLRLRDFLRTTPRGRP